MRLNSNDIENGKPFVCHSVRRLIDGNHSQFTACSIWNRKPIVSEPRPSNITVNPANVQH